MRTMASQWDKSADLFALTARSLSSHSGECTQSSAALLLQVHTKKTAEETTGQADRIACRHTAAACFVVPWQEFESAQVRRDAADGVAREPNGSTFHKVQVQPIKQSIADDFGDEAA